jgi:hypothetical protein
MRLSVSKINRTYITLGVFAIAMGFLEAIVVVYLRQIYYPRGFDFPLKLLSPQMLSVEWIREIATIIMLAAIGIISGKNNLQRLLLFLFTFAIWDIFYYVALKLFLDWPPSLLTWDLLFLIPLPWIGPVLAPVICSLTMILMAVGLISIEKRGCEVKIRLPEWGLIFSGSLVILWTYLIDYLRIIFRSEGICSGKKVLQQSIDQFEPEYFNWWLFAVGEILILSALAIVFIRIRREYRVQNPGFRA